MTMSKETGGPAFPVVQWETDDDGNLCPQQTVGMTLRDYFAAEAMREMSWADKQGSAEECYEIADAMLKARNK